MEVREEELKRERKMGGEEGIENGEGDG
ncbi:hypothetical protein Pcinc_040229, partial [Petrolisthes cinctipes]